MSEASEPRAVPAVRPMKLSHGTLSCRDLQASRRFYEEFLGLECVRHQSHAMVATFGREWAIVCLQVGDRGENRSALHHFGIDVASKEEVDAAHARAVEGKERWGLQKIQTVGHQHGTYAFYLQDRDGNWWEIQHVGDLDYRSLFARGDIPTPAATRRA